MKNSDWRIDDKTTNSRIFLAVFCAMHGGALQVASIFFKLESSLYGVSQKECFLVKYDYFQSWQASL